MIFSSETLEFNLIKEKISKLTYSKFAYNQIKELKPDTNYHNVLTSLNETNELLTVIAKYGNIPFLANFDNNILSFKQTNRVYSIEDFLYLKLFLRMNLDITKYFNTFKSEIKLNIIKKYFELYINKDLNNKLEDTFNDYGEIHDTATKELRSIRSKTKTLTSNLNAKMQELLIKYNSYLSESIITIRNNRPCLAIKDSYKNKIKGVIHDFSQSKQTVFIEPELSLKINAEIELNKLLEQKEIDNILRELTILVNNSFLDFKNNQDILLKLDILNAKAKYSLNEDGILPKINNEGFINLVNACHPLIPKNQVVPINLTLSKTKNTLLITGPNTGGKTVTLKTVGLLTLMIQSGILVPVNIESSLAVFDNVFVDIGDEQSLENSLSTFSSHMNKIINFLNNLTDNSLVLLDEIGSGTDPNEGVALAISIIEEFLLKDIRMIVTSHFSELKTYAYEKEEISLASVDFDIKTLKPLYKLKHGIIGESHARLIATRLGMKPSVIERANNLFLAKESELNKIISKLNREKEELEVEKNNLRTLEDKFNLEIEKTKEERDRLINEQENLLKEIRLKEEKFWKDKIDEVNLLIEIIEEEKNIKEHHVANLKGLVNISEPKQKIKTKEESILKGDLVFIKPYQQIGTVTNINGEKYLVKFGNFELEFNKSDLSKRDKKEEVKPERVRKPKNQAPNHNYDKSSKLSVDLRGYRVHEVDEKLDKAIDQALLSNISTLTIIHGFGTGAIKSTVDNYIRKSSLIKSSRSGGEGEGLAGVTIINLL